VYILVKERLERVDKHERCHIGDTRVAGKITLRLILGFTQPLTEMSTRNKNNNVSGE
jgi:hypothetical protein